MRYALIMARPGGETYMVAEFAFEDDARSAFYKLTDIVNSGTYIKILDTARDGTVQEFTKGVPRPLGRYARRTCTHTGDGYIPQSRCSQCGEWMP